MMPYIKTIDRAEVDMEYGYRLPNSAGEINYLITKLCINYINDHGLRYEHVNAVVGALECAKLELYRRLAAPYEDTKSKENGDIYP